MDVDVHFYSEPNEMDLKFKMLITLQLQHHRIGVCEF